MSYIIFRGASTANLPGVEVSEMPSHGKASMRTTQYYIKGRDGALHVDDGYANFDTKAVLVLIDATAATRQLVNAWADGTGKLITSDDLTKAFLASVKQEIKWTRIRGNSGYYDTAKITFNCQPYMVEAVDTVLVLTETGTIASQGNMTAYPLIKVEGSGDVTFTFNGENIAINDMAANVPVYIDCETGYIYTETGSAKTMTGEIPTLSIGTNTVTFGNNLTKLTVTPRWRWI